MFKRIPQPPVNPASRSLEHHRFWPGIVVALAGGVLLIYGALHLLGVNTVTGNAASETQLMKAFASSGLQYADELALPAPPKLDDPAAQADAIDRWIRQQTAATPPTWKIRVDTAAKTPCPT